jgi:acyl transferase domain-containing protein/acyl carrier protein
MTKDNTYTGLEIAVVGMAGRFPGAPNIQTFWDNLVDGKESIHFFTDEELQASGVSPASYNDPAYVKAASLLEDKDCFDAAFFNYRPDEALMMDPQTRILHECVWNALEDAGLVPEQYAGQIGLFAGAADNLNWRAYTQLIGDRVDVDAFSQSQLTVHSHANTLVAHKLKLNGPAVSMYTACSTSLVAIHQACRSLLTGECKAVLAGGVTISTEPRQGYKYEEVMIRSNDGHCRAFDSASSGTIEGEGVGIVVLKRLKAAQKDGDHIYAVIKGSATNNDADRKVGFTAPSVEGQSECIKMAHKFAKVDPKTISYVEAHGTATGLGDPIELEALQLALGDRPTPCLVGSVKSNIGHLDSAAGVTGFIKTVLSVYNKAIPASLHFNELNPRVDNSSNRIQVNAELQQWPANNAPRRAGVSSFGIGGTNAHVVIEEAPAQNSDKSTKAWHLLPISAKTEAALERRKLGLQEWLSKHPNENLADVAHTLQSGRVPLSIRQTFAVQSNDNAIQALANSDVPSNSVKEAPKVVFMFPGQGGQYLNMAGDLYHEEPVFKKYIDECASFLGSEFNYDLIELLYPTEQQKAEAEERIHNMRDTHPILFSFEYALARTLMHYGVEPDFVIGHSQGEYVAACISGVMPLEDALRVTVKRGELMASMPDGKMMSVNMSEQEILKLLPAEVVVAVVNSSTNCVLSGPSEAIDKFAAHLTEKIIEHRILHIAKASHSPLMQDAVEPLKACLETVSFKTPTIPYLSNLHGKLVQENEIDAAYWANHLLNTVRFVDGLDFLFEKKDVIFVEVGPGKQLINAVRQHPNFKADQHPAVQTTRHILEEQNDNTFFLNQLGALWTHGVKVNFTAFHEGTSRQIVHLPGYPFAKSKFPTEVDSFGMLGQITGTMENPKLDAVKDWIYSTEWKRVARANSAQTRGQHCLFFYDRTSECDAVLSSLKQRFDEVTIVQPGTSFGTSESAFSIVPNALEDYTQLFNELRAQNNFPTHIVHGWLLAEESAPLSLDTTKSWADKGYFSLLSIARAVGFELEVPLKLDVLSTQLHDVIGTEQIQPSKALSIGAVKVIAKEYEHLFTRSIDIDDKTLNAPDQLLHTLFSTDDSLLVALRNGKHWIQSVEKVEVANDSAKTFEFKTGGTYLVTGAQGGIGKVFSTYLAKHFQAQLILVGRRELAVEYKNELQQLGATIHDFQCDVSDAEALQVGLAPMINAIGPIHGVIHTAGKADYAGVIHRRTTEDDNSIFAPKVAGTIALANALADTPPEFMLLCSSMASLYAQFGQAAYVAANIFQNHFATWFSHKTNCISVAWDAWQEVGLAVESVQKLDPESREKALSKAIKPDEGIEVLNLILQQSIAEQYISTVSLVEHAEKFNSLQAFKDEHWSDTTTNDWVGTIELADESSALNAEFRVPETDTEKKLAEMWSKFFGIKNIGLNHNFFELGGDSLRAMVLLTRIRTQFTVTIKLPDLFQNPSLEQLAEEIDKALWVSEETEESTTEGQTTVTI